MDDASDPAAASVEDYVSIIQKQMGLLSEELGNGQTLQVLVPLNNGSSIHASSFGCHPPDLIKIVGTDEKGQPACVFLHKQALQVVLKKVSPSSDVKPEEAFPHRGESTEISFNETA